MRGEEPQGMGAPLDIETLMSVLVTGGWPALLDTNVDAAMLVNQGYVDQIVEIDVHRLLGTRRDPVKLRRVIQALARCVGNQRSVTKLAAEAGGTDGSLDRDTVSTYLDELTRLRILEDLPAWNAHLCSRASLMQQPKRMFVDPSLAPAVLGASPDKLLADLEYAGFLFEHLVVRDLRVLAQPLGGRLSHARTSDNYEVDAIVELRDGTWAAFEIKLGHSWVDAGAESLKKFANTVDTTRRENPLRWSSSYLMALRIAAQMASMWCPCRHLELKFPVTNHSPSPGPCPAPMPPTSFCAPGSLRSRFHRRLRWRTITGVHNYEPCHLT